MSLRSPLWFVVFIAWNLAGCEGDASVGDDAGATPDAGVGDAGDFDAAGEPSDSGALDGGRADGGTADAAAPDDAAALDADTDAGLRDAGTDAAAPDAGTDAGIDAAAADAGTDAGRDAGSDAGAPSVTCTESGLTTETISDSASVGTPDTYFRSVRPGDPFCAEISGGGGGSWGVTVSNGTSSGVYCRDTPRCAIRVPPGQTTLLVTATTTDIGFYTLTIRRVIP